MPHSIASYGVQGWNSYVDSHAARLAKRDPSCRCESPAVAVEEDEAGCEYRCVKCGRSVRTERVRVGV